MEGDKKNITFNIYGGNNQILPNATKAEQHFYGDLFTKEALRKDSPEIPPLTRLARRQLRLGRWLPQCVRMSLE